MTYSMTTSNGFTAGGLAVILIALGLMFFGFGAGSALGWVGVLMLVWFFWQAFSGSVAMGVVVALGLIALLANGG